MRRDAAAAAKADGRLPAREELDAAVNRRLQQKVPEMIRWHGVGMMKQVKKKPKAPAKKKQKKGLYRRQEDGDGGDDVEVIEKPSPMPAGMHRPDIHISMKLLPFDLCAWPVFQSFAGVVFFLTHAVLISFIQVSV